MKSICFLIKAVSNYMRSTKSTISIFKEEQAMSSQNSDANYRRIQEVIRKEKTHWVGTAFKTANYFPGDQPFPVERFSPFVLMDYNFPFEFPPALTPKTSGPHPHRGLETVSIVFEGALEHKDNAGNFGKVMAGEVQWMSAGSGILHKETHEEEFSREGGILHALQLWLNTPTANKGDAPDYQHVSAEEMGYWNLPQENGSVTVIAGAFGDVMGPARTYTALDLYSVRLNQNGRVHIDQPADFNTGILLIEGKVRINEERDCSEKDFILFQNEEGRILVETEGKGAKFIVLSGEPIDEPVVVAGTFVMTSQEEIERANDDYRAGVFGSLDF